VPGSAVFGGPSAYRLAIKNAALKIDKRTAPRRSIAGSSGLPVGLQIVGRQYADRQVLSACLAFERVFGRAPSAPGSK
jgi:Asp-tRNA(Asn)/Glu-tRNA(Gln) amidotransferase A subunit family amidase